MPIAYGSYSSCVDIEIFGLAGLYETFETDVPLYALNSYVDLVGDLVGNWCKGFVNGRTPIKRFILRFKGTATAESVHGSFQRHIATWLSEADSRLHRYCMI